jgi:phage-related tail protein
MAELSSVAQGATQGVSRDSLLQSAYKVSLSAEGQKVGAEAFTQLGFAPKEAAQMAMVARGIAKAAGSYDNFVAVIDGKAESAKLSEREMAMLRSLAARGGGDLAQLGSWSGSSGRTWEGHAVK